MDKLHSVYCAVLVFILCIIPVYGECDKGLISGRANNSIRIELSSTSSPPGSPSALQFLIFNEGNEAEDVGIKTVDGFGFNYSYADVDRITVPACYWKEIAVTVIHTDPVMEKMPNNLTVLATGNRTGTVSKTIPYYPYRISKHNSPAYCYNQTVIGSCNHNNKSAEYSCSSQRWEAQAVIMGSFEIRSLPVGLFVPNSRVLATMPGSLKPNRRQSRISVSVGTTCCLPFVQIISGDPETNPISSTCVVDVTKFIKINALN